MVIKWARRGVYVYLGTLWVSQKHNKDIGNGQNWGLKNFFDCFLYKFNPPDGQKPEPNIVYFLAQNFEKMKTEPKLATRQSMCSEQVREHDLTPFQTLDGPLGRVKCQKKVVKNRFFLGLDPIIGQKFRGPLGFCLLAREYLRLGGKLTSNAKTQLTSQERYGTFGRKFSRSEPRVSWKTRAPPPNGGVGGRRSGGGARPFLGSKLHSYQTKEELSGTPPYLQTPRPSLQPLTQDLYPPPSLAHFVCVLVILPIGLINQGLNRAELFMCETNQVAW